MTWVFDHSRATGNDRLVLLSLADHADDEEWECWPSLERIAVKALVSVRTVQRSIATLVELGELEVAPGGGRGRSNRYRLTGKPGQPVIVSSDGERVTDSAGKGDRFAETMTPEARKGDTCVQGTVREPSIEPPREPSRALATRNGQVVTPMRPFPPSVSETQAFVAFWGVYPRKVGKGAARPAFERALRKTDLATIVASAVAFARHHEAEATETRFIPYPAKWLNGEHWTDEKSETWGDRLDRWAAEGDNVIETEGEEIL